VVVQRGSLDCKSWVPEVHSVGKRGFDNVYVWTYEYLLKRISEVAEEYGITVVYNLKA
jgi:hypothetical protein